MLVRLFPRVIGTPGASDQTEPSQQQQLPGLDRIAIAQVNELRDRGLVEVRVAGGTGGACGGSGNNRTVTFTSLAANASATITLIAQVSCSVVDGAMISNSATVGSLASDPNLSNNTLGVTTGTCTATDSGGRN